MFEAEKGLKVDLVCVVLFGTVLDVDVVFAVDVVVGC